MSEDTTGHSPGELLGDYRLDEIVQEGARTKSWRAEQVSMNRAVVLETLKEEFLSNLGEVERFIDDVRVKAAVDHPAICPVYEAVRSEEVVFYSRAVLPGRSLEELVSKWETLRTTDLLRILERVGEAMIYLEQAEIATVPLTERDLVLGQEGSISLSNLAIGGERSLEVVWQDRETIAECVRQLIRPDEPGATRFGRLMNYLTATGEEEVSWQQIVKAAEKLRRELEVGEQVVAEKSPVRISLPKNFGLLVALVMLGCVLAGGFVMMVKKAPEREELLESFFVQVPEGSYSGPDGREVRTGQIWVESFEVTIGEYARFLESLELVAESSRTVYDHPEQPSQKRGHEPKDWDVLYRAAKEKTEWNGVQVSLSCPVVNVDWWDAYAYADWKGGRLPTREEWMASRRGTMPALSGWGPVNESREDVADGIHGLAGNVSEWSRDVELDPMMPMNPRSPVVCGASYLQREGGAKASIWLESRETRRPDIGFRVVYDEAPE